MFYFLTSERRTGITLAALTVVIIMLAALAGAGCATRGDVQALSGHVTANQVAAAAATAELKGLLVGLGVKFDAVAAKQMTPEQVKAIMATTVGGLATQATVDKIAELVETQGRESREGIANIGTGFNALGREVEGVKTGVSTVATRVEAVAQTVGEVKPDKSGKAKTIVERIDQVGARVGNIATGVAGLARRVGRLQHGTGGEVVQITFPAAKLTADGSFAACAEITPAAKKYLDREVVSRLDGGKWEVDSSVVGFANTAPFVDTKGKPLANSDELNSRCAEARAKALAEYIESATKAKVKVAFEGGGTTSKFSLPGVGDVAADRSAVVVLKRKEATGASPAGAGGTKPPTPPTSTGKQLTFDLGWNAADEAAAKALATKLTSAGYKAESYQEAGSNWYVRHTLAANSDKEATAASIAADKTAGTDSSVSQVSWRVQLQNREFAEADKAKASELVAKLKATGVEASVSEGTTGTPPVKVFRVYVERFDVEAEAIAAKVKIDGLNLNNPTTIERQ